MHSLEGRSLVAGRIQETAQRVDVSQQPATNFSSHWPSTGGRLATYGSI